MMDGLLDGRIDGWMEALLGSQMAHLSFYRSDGNILLLRLLRGVTLLFTVSPTYCCNEHRCYKYKTHRTAFQKYM